MSNLYHSDSYNTWPYSGENLAWAYANQGEAVKAWVEEEYELWKCEGNWEDVDGVGHMTAAMWKGVDLIGCANVEQYYVCQYGSVHCKDKDEPYGGAACTDTTPPHLPNFNSEGCYDTCVACKDDTEQCYNAPEEAPAEEECGATCFDITCDAWVADGVSCEALALYGCDCTGCSCVSYPPPGPPVPYSRAPTYSSGELPPCEVPADGSRGSCESCFHSDHCIEGYYCCPYMRKCIMSAGQSCYNFADCDPRCYDTSCDKNEGCDCEGCAKVGEGKTYGWLEWANLGLSFKNSPDLTCSEPSASAASSPSPPPPPSPPPATPDDGYFYTKISDKVIASNPCSMSAYDSTNANWKADNQYYYTSLADCEELCSAQSDCLAFVDNRVSSPPTCIFKASTQTKDASDKDVYVRQEMVYPPPPPPNSNGICCNCTIQMDISNFDDSTYKSQFVSLYSNEVAREAGVEESSVHVLDIVPGSVVVESLVDFESQEDATKFIEKVMRSQQSNDTNYTMFSEEFTQTYGAAMITEVSSVVEPSPPPSQSDSDTEGDDSNSSDGGDDLVILYAVLGNPPSCKCARAWRVS
ncbi:hypothetical protein CYMTET_32034 [Cymbomonas tetramitiformis]|uniref:SCP domain-containing protein n=1 Tax=Cymbomonas tetramitiformis TaxID=36881 RepID=A0AAE0FG80_9CHLO|nr:hypothetical protein CYMTET_32034 [Cymbomonas tetramitiformis]